LSGPSLRKVDAHTSIHEASLNEAKELNELFQMCLKENQAKKAFRIAEVIIEHWETRTLRHAEAEEEGLYLEMVEGNPELQNLVIQLTRDHDLMRTIVERMKKLQANNEISEEMIKLQESIVIIDSIHNEDEMNKLLKNNK
jgi:hypothetical protein